MATQTYTRKARATPKPGDVITPAPFSSDATKLGTYGAAGQQYRAGSGTSTPAPTSPTPLNTVGAGIGSPIGDTSGAAPTDVRTDEQKARDLVDYDLQKKNALGTELFGDPTLEPSSMEQKVNELKAKQQRETEVQQTEQMKQNELLSSGFQTAQREGNAAIAGTQSGLAQSREEAMSAGNPMVVDQFTGIVQQRLKDAQTKYNLQTDQMQQLRNNLAEAQKSGRQDLVNQYQAQITNKEQEIKKTQTDLNNSQKDLSDQALKIAQQEAVVRNNAFTFFDKLAPGALGTMDAAAVAQLFGVDGMTAAQLKGLDTRRLALRPDDPDYQYKMAQINKEVAETKYVGMTNEQKNYLVYQSLPSQSQKDSFMEFINANPDYSVFKVGEDAYSFDPKTSAVKRIVDSSGNGGGNYIPTGTFTTQQINGKSYTLDSGAMVSFMSANESAKTLGFGVIQTQSESTASLRSQNEQYTLFGQGRTPEQLAAQGVPPSFSQPKLPVVTWTPNNSKHLTGLAIDLSTAPGYAEKMEPLMNAQGWFRPPELRSGDPTHFEFKGTTSTAAGKAQAIFNGSSNQKTSDLPQKERSEVEAELNKLRTQAITSGDVIGYMRASAGGSPADQNFRTSFEKAATVIQQLSTIEALAAKVNGEKDADGNAITDSGFFGSGPIIGRLRGLNPYDQDAKTLQAALIAITPNLARGVYNEVGVLTDNDVKLYQGTLPNLTETADIQKAVTALTLRTIRNSLDAKLKTAAGLSTDVSGLVPFYQQLNSQIDILEKSLGVNTSNTGNSKIGTSGLTLPTSLTPGANNVLNGLQ